MSLYLKKFSTHSEYEQYINGSGAILPNVSICTTEGDVHYNPYVDPCASEKVKTTYEWVEIGGVKWATKNVGALTVTDYGQKFSWGGTKGYTNDQVSGTCKSHKFYWTDYEHGTSSSNLTKYNSTDGKSVLEAEDDAATVNMGSDWRMPTTAEFQALGTATTSAWTADYEGSGVAGLVLTSKSDSSKKLFFPAAGSCGDGSMLNVGKDGLYWSSSLDSSNKTYGKCLYFIRSGCVVDSYYRSYGCSVRGVVG